MDKRTRRPSAAMLVALLALVVSMSGTAVAAGFITSADIKNDEVKSADLKNNGIKSKDVRDGAITSADVADGSIELADLSGAAKAALSEDWDPSQTLKSGRSITGSVYYQIGSSAASQVLDQTIAFPAR